MTHKRLAQRAGVALVWKAAQLASLKGIFLIRLLILARLLAPEDFGLMAIATVAIGFLMTITDLGIVPALVQRADPEESHYHSAWTIGIVRGLAVTGVLVLMAPVIAGLFAEPRATPIVAVIALRPLLDATASIKVAELTRNLQFRSLGLIHVSAAIVELVVSVAFARAFGVWSLVMGALAGSVTGVVASYAWAPYTPRLVMRGDAIRPLVQYGRWIFATGLVALAGSSVLQIVISRRLGAGELGLYFLATKFAFLPYEVISEGVGSVAFPVYARLQSDLRQTARAFRAVFTAMAALLVPIYALMIVFAPSLTQIVLGAKWEGAAPIIQLLALAGMIGIFGDTTGPVLRGLGQPAKVLAVEIVQSGLLIVSAWYLAGRYGLIGAGVAWLLAVGVSQWFSALFICRLIQRPLAGLTSPVLAIAAVSGASTAVALSVNTMVPGIAGTVLSIFVAVAFTGVLLWILDLRLELGLTASLRQAFPQVFNLIPVRI